MRGNWKYCEFLYYYLGILSIKESEETRQKKRKEKTIEIILSGKKK